MSKVVDHDVITFRPVNEVRWMSLHFAVKPLVRNYRNLIDYYAEQVEEDNDPVAKYCLTKLKDQQIHVAIIGFNDVLEELAQLCCIFQRSCITTIEVIQFAKAKINKLRAQYLGETIYWGEEVVKLLSTYPDVDTAVVLRFIERVCNHLQERFPDGELQEWIAFDTQAILTQTKFDFGKEEVEKLAAKYGHFFTYLTPTSISAEYQDLWLQKN